MIAKTKAEHRWWPTAVAIIIAVAVIAVAAHSYVVSLERQARDPNVTLARRSWAVNRAVALEPWSRTVVVTRAIVESQSLLARGEVDRAYFLLLPLTQTVRDDALFRRSYQDVVAEKCALDSRKAHRQHAREKEDGSLDPEDVLK